MMDYMHSHDELMDDALLNPDDEHATELGEVPQSEEKGSIGQSNMFAPYMYGRYLYQWKESSMNGEDLSMKQ